RRSAMRDRALISFAGAAAVVALHTFADAFIWPEPGTGWSDHLVPGFATLAVLVAMLAVFWFARPGLRAVLALVLGALAVEGAVLAIVDARNVGVRGDDWTGFLLLPAGLALCLLGTALLWRSRRPGRLRWLRRAGLALAAVLGAYWVVAPLAMAIGATHRPRQAVAPVVLGRPYEQVTVRTGDGLGLAGWYVRSRNGAAIVSYPTRKGKLPQARMLIRHGYGVLLLDARGYDGSEGTPNVFGWGEAKDIDAAVAWLRRQPDVQDGRIAGIGFSVGGEMMLQAAAENTGLRAVVSDGAGFRSVREEVLRGPRGWFTSVPEQAVQSLALAVMSGTPPPPSLKNLVPRIAPRHVFFIYAGRGAGGEEFNVDYYRAAHAPKALWKIPEAHHTGGYEARPPQYEQRVVRFFDRALLGKN
ncbi:MAG TPA: alpha/beta fold hydrolase, partial [Gemmatimonadaceae bacterium]|nr:alpha/beta fold hydrolase [Gemmatimonadaceae bacterium]